MNTLMQTPVETTFRPWLALEPARRGSAGPQSLARLTATFEPIGLKQLDAVALLNRIDTKFVMPQEQFLDVLARLQPDYWMLEIDRQRLNHYRTLYFDTPDFALYTAHVNGRAERYKVRSREYIDSRRSFLEVKHKTRKDRTIKDRIPTAQPALLLTPELSRWLHDVSPLDGAQLEAKLWNTFTRLTLVGKRGCERVTLDVDLAFYTEQHSARLDGLVIAELKMDAENHASPFLAQMRAQRIHPCGFSKYSVGVSLLYEQVKKNRLKSKMLQINKIMRGVVCDD